MHDEKKIRELDRRLARAPTADGKPGWWRGDEDATRASMAVAAALGVRVRTPATTAASG